MSTARAAHPADTHSGFAIGRRVIAGVVGGIAGGVPQPLTALFVLKEGRIRILHVTEDGRSCVWRNGSSTWPPDLLPPGWRRRWSRSLMLRRPRDADALRAITRRTS